MSLINKASVRKFMLEYAGRNRHHKFTRVGREAIEFVEMKVREACRARVDGAPSKGKTL